MVVTMGTIARVGLGRAIDFYFQACVTGTWSTAWPLDLAMGDARPETFGHNFEHRRRRVTQRHVA